MFRNLLSSFHAAPAALLLLTQLNACTVVGPSFQSPQAVVSAQPRAGSVVRWTVFQDPMLLHLQQLAAQANLDVKTAALRLMQSRVNETTVSAQRGPRLDARGAVVRQRLSESGSATRVAGALGGGLQEQIISVLSTPFTIYQAGFDASWEPDLWGRVARSEESARAASDGQQAMLRQVQLSVVAEVARAYFQLRSVQDQGQLIQEELAVAQEVEQLLAAQRQGGLTDESALIKQRSVLAGLAASLPTLADREARAINQIAFLCGLKADDLRDQLSVRTARAEARLPDLHLGLSSELVRNRPDLAAAEASLHAATANIGLAMADLYPRITIGASFGLETVAGEKFGAWGSRQWSVGPSLSIPIFDRGRRHSIVTLRELQQQESAVAYQQTVLKAWQEVENALSGYLAETQRGVQLAQKIAFSEDEANLARARFTNGMTNYLPISNAQMTLLEARRDLAEHHERLNSALTALYKALGDDGSARTAEN